MGWIGYVRVGNNYSQLNNHGFSSHLITFAYLVHISATKFTMEWRREWKSVILFLYLAANGYKKGIELRIYLFEKVE